MALPSGAGAFRLFAETLFDAGYSPLPVIPGQKKPALRAWSNFCASPMPRSRIRSYAARWPGASLGLALGYAGVIALDVDTEDASQLAAICGAVPPSPVVKVGAKGFTAFYRVPPGAIVPSRHYTGGAMPRRLNAGAARERRLERRVAPVGHCLFLSEPCPWTMPTLHRTPTQCASG